MDSSQVSQAKPAEIQLDKYEVQPRHLGGLGAGIASVLAIGLSLFQLFTSWRGPFEPFVQRSIHLAFVFSLIFLIYPFSRKSPTGRTIPFMDKVFFGLSIAASLWITFNSARISVNPELSGTTDLILGLIMIVVVLEGSRRVLGPALPIMALLVIIYALLGPYFPGFWAHRGYTPSMIIECLYVRNNGAFGFIVGISATIVAGFLIFGVLLSKTGGSETFVDLALRLTGRSYGGPAKVSCFSSAFFGTVSGSAVANVVVDGVFNIPLMKSLGYKKEFAGAVEATNSSAGQLVPPIMGAGAFIMAEFLQIPYSRVAVAAIMPAFLFYLCCFMGIHFEAKRIDLKPVPPELIPSFREKILPNCIPFILPVSFLVYFLSAGYTAARCVLYAIIVSVLLHLIPKKGGISLRQKIRILLNALDEGGRTVAMVGALCASAQMVVGMFTITGLAVKVSSVIVDLGSGIVFISLFFGMIVSVILGMGIPTTAAYVLSASVVAPALTTIGVLPLSAHMFVFYFAVLSAITPPICAAVFVASTIAEARWWPTARNACKLGIAGFIVPYMFHYAPSLLFEGKLALLFLNSATAILGIVALSAGVMGFFLRKLSFFERLVMTACAFLLVYPSAYTDIGAIVVLAYMYASQRFTKSSALALHKAETASSTVSIGMKDEEFLPDKSDSSKSGIL